MPDFINVENATFSYPTHAHQSVAALTNIEFKIRSGEFVALIGPNGSGKSTLARLLNALLLPDSGRVLIAGMDTRERTLHAQIRSQVGLIFQRPQNQIVATTVEEDVAFGPANLGLEPQEIRGRVEDALARTGLSSFRQRPSYLLSAGETQRLALAGVLAIQPRCIIFDETTAMLDPSGREMVMAQIADLNKRGITTLLITHLMEEAAQAQRVILLNEGQLILDEMPERIFSGDFSLTSYGLDLPPARIAAGRLRKFIPKLSTNILTSTELLTALPQYLGPSVLSADIPDSQPQSSHAYIQIRDLSFTYQLHSPLAHQALSDLNLQVEKLHTHAIIGSTGCGKSTLLQHLNGLMRPQSGNVRVGPYDLADKNLDIQALRRSTALAFQQPEDQIFEQFVGDEIAYAPRHLGYTGKLVDVVANAMRSVGLDFSTYKDRLTSTLSGGEKRKVALASILAIQADLILLDEPLAGLDPRSVGELLRTLTQLYQQEKTLLISTHQYDELIPILQEVSMIDHGHNVLHGKAEAVFSQTSAMEAAGLKAPLAARIAAELRRKGWPLSKPTASLESLEMELHSLPSRE